MVVLVGKEVGGFVAHRCSEDDRFVASLAIRAVALGCFSGGGKRALRLRYDSPLRFVALVASLSCVRA